MFISGFLSGPIIKTVNKLNKLKQFLWFRKFFSVLCHKNSLSTSFFRKTLLKSYLIIITNAEGIQFLFYIPLIEINLVTKQITTFVYKECFFKILVTNPLVQ